MLNSEIQGSLEQARRKRYRHSAQGRLAKQAQNRRYKAKHAVARRDAAREWWRAHPEALRAKQQRYAERNREKKRAHSKVQAALRAGKLVRQPCRVCGDPESHAHHADYSQPLVVDWLCSPHHVEAQNAK